MSESERRLKIVLKSQADKYMKKKEKEIISNVEPTLVSPDTTQELLEKNLKWSHLIFEQNKKIQSRLTWMLIGSYLKLLLVLVPLIIAAVYLPSFLENIFSQYQPFFETSGGETLDVDAILSNLSADQIKGVLEILGK